MSPRLRPQLRGFYVALFALLANSACRSEPGTDGTSPADVPSGSVEAAARREGSLSFYTSIAEKDLPALIGPFEAKYGVSVRVWRASTEKVLQRAVAEAGARRADMDVVHISSPEMEALSRERVLAPITSPAHDHLQPGSIPAHREWAATVLSVWVQAYNPTLIDRESLPKSYDDLLDPRWKGKLGIEANDQDWVASVADVLGGSAGLDFFRRLVAGNGVSVRAGHTLLTNLVISGEVPLALTVYNYMPEQARKRGAPIDWFALDPAIARSNGVGVALTAPHPNAARLFYEYLLGEEAQRAFGEMDYVPANTRVASPLAGIRIVQVDPARTLDEFDEWTAFFERTFIRGGS